MLKHLIAGLTLVVSMNAFAGQDCNRTVEKISDEPLDLNTLTVKELKIVKHKLKESKENVDYIYHYTITHNRIYKKTVFIENENRFANLREQYKSDQMKLQKLQELEKTVDIKLNQVFDVINYKTEFLRDKKLEYIDQQIEAVEKEINEKGFFSQYWS